MKLRKLDIKIADAISKMGVFHGMFIDGYNRSASDIAGCITARVDASGDKYVIEMKNEARVNIVGKWSPNNESNGNVYDADGLSPTIVSGAHGGCEPRIKEENVPISTDFRIRKLTERECFRLMGVRENDIDKLLKAGISKTQLYKLAGNSIVCDVLMGIFSNLLIAADNDELF